MTHLIAGLHGNSVHWIGGWRSRGCSAGYSDLPRLSQHRLRQQPRQLPTPRLLIPQHAELRPATQKKTYIVPAGTKVLLQLRSSVNTKSAKSGDGVYLASAFPVVVGNHVMIPTGVYVQGVVDRVERAGRCQGQIAAGHALYFHHFSQWQGG